MTEINIARLSVAALILVVICSYVFTQRTKGLAFAVGFTVLVLLLALAATISTFAAVGVLDELKYHPLGVVFWDIFITWFFCAASWIVTIRFAIRSIARLKRSEP